MYRLVIYIKDMKLKKVLLTAVLLVAVITFFYSFILPKFKLNSTRAEEFIQINVLKNWEFYHDNCFDKSFVPTLDKLQNNLEKWSGAYDRKCQTIWKKFQTMYTVEIRTGTQLISEPFSKRVKSWLGNDDVLYNDVFHQTILDIRNMFTREETVFNLLRSKKPSDQAEKREYGYLERMSTETKQNCDFCAYSENTAEDVFGRIKGKFSVSASNTFKLEKWHGLVLGKSHNPLDISLQEFLDMFNTSLKWFYKAHSTDGTSGYPMSSFDTLPKGGASQFHPHIHTFLSPRYLDHMRDQLDAAQAYSKATGENMWQDLLEIHYALGLVVVLGDAVAVSPLTPQREYELVLLSNQPQTDLFRLFYYVLKTYAHMQRPCFSAGMAYPNIPSEGQSRRAGEALPAMIRVGTRGRCSSQTSDISSLDLYLMRNVNVDSYFIIAKLKETLKKYDVTVEPQAQMFNLYTDEIADLI